MSRNWLRVLFALSAIFSLNASAADAASHDVFLSPYYCLPGNGVTDATASFIAINGGRGSIPALNLVVPQNSTTIGAYGLVQSAAPVSFGSLSFDAKNVNRSAFVVVHVTQKNGQPNAGVAFFSDCVTAPTLDTPSGWFHCVARTSKFFAFDNGPFDKDATFAYATLLQFEDSSATRSTQVANVRLNDQAKNAVAVTRQAENNCALIDEK